jgi:thiol-disulfide isomerase/thioredoxin
MSLLEKTTHLCLIGVSVLAGYVLIEHRAVDQKRTETFVGKRVSLPAGSLRSRNVVVVLNTHCRFCRESAPFYRQLGAEAARNSTSASFIVLTFEPLDQMRAFLDQLGIGSSKVAVMPDSLDTRVTPTMLLVDQKGVVVDAMVGELSKAGERKPVEFLENHL